MVLLATLEFARGGDANDIVKLPRLHHQFLPDQVFYEADALSPEQRDALIKFGHHLEQTPESYGDLQAVVWDRRSGVTAASDARGQGTARLQKRL